MAKSAAPLLLVGGAALLLMSGKKKKKGKTSCPPVTHIFWENVPVEIVHVDFEDNSSADITIPRVGYTEAVGGNRDIINITAKVLAPFLEESCLTSDSVKVDFRSHSGDRRIYGATEFFFMVAADLLSDFYTAGLFGYDELQYAQNELTKWWVSKMGEAPLPKD